MALLLFVGFFRTSLERKTINQIKYMNFLTSTNYNKIEANYIDQDNYNKIEINVSLHV